MLTKFLNSKRPNLSQSTYTLYLYCLSLLVKHYEISSDGINSFLANLTCGNAKVNYHRVINTFVRCLLKTGYLKENPLDKVDKPKPARKLLPSITEEQLNTLAESVDNLRDKLILSLLFDSGLRLRELSNIKQNDLDWNTYTITIVGKGNKQRKAPFSERSAALIREWLSQYSCNGGNIWGINRRGIQTMLRRLSLATGIEFSCHSFRRGFACNLHRKGLSTLDIMHLGGWEDLSMVLRYTRSITFEDCLEHYRAISKS